ncbi:hypothetical protein GCM10018966_021760 [Streptomyces yanii]
MRSTGPISTSAQSEVRSGLSCAEEVAKQRDLGPVVGQFLIDPRDRFSEKVRQINEQVIAAVAVAGDREQVKGGADRRLDEGKAPRRATRAPASARSLSPRAPHGRRAWTAPH